MRNFFKGWYFKIQSQKYSIALIPSFSADAGGNKSASIQIVTADFSDCAIFDFGDYVRAGKDLPPDIRIGNSEFSPRYVKLNFNTKSHSVKGELFFGPLARPRFDIMGPFSLVPFMECRHRVYSMLHSVYGSISVDGVNHDFSDSIGYIEGDEGRSFPKEYLWTQYISKELSIMLSVAEIPLAGARFTGIIGFIYEGGREIRLATYLGARAEFIGQGKAVIRQGNYTFTAEMLSKGSLPLYAPLCGSMSRFIRENISCSAQYDFRKGDSLIFKKTTDRTGFEYEYAR